MRRGRSTSVCRPGSWPGWLACLESALMRGTPDGFEMRPAVRCRGCGRKSPECTARKRKCALSMQIFAPGGNLSYNGLSISRGIVCRAFDPDGTGQSQAGTASSCVAFEDQVKPELLPIQWSACRLLPRAGSRRCTGLLLAAADADVRAGLCVREHAAG